MTIIDDMGVEFEPVRELARCCGCGESETYGSPFALEEAYRQCDLCGQRTCDACLAVVTSGADALVACTVCRGCPICADGALGDRQCGQCSRFVCTGHLTPVGLRVFCSECMEPD